MPAKPTISPHSLGDWCHLCGSRRSRCADICYASNAEHGGALSKYLRICADCAKRIADATAATLAVEP